MGGRRHLPVAVAGAHLLRRGGGGGPLPNRAPRQSRLIVPVVRLIDGAGSLSMTAMWQGSVVSIHIAPAAGLPMETVPEARAFAGRGLEGDRHSLRLRRLSHTTGAGRSRPT